MRCPAPGVRPLSQLPDDGPSVTAIAPDSSENWRAERHRGFPDNVFSGCGRWTNTAGAAPPPGAARFAPMKTYSYRLTLLDVPADLRADPDGNWTYESLVSAAGLDPEASPPPLVAALFEPWRGHPEG